MLVNVDVTDDNGTGWLLILLMLAVLFFILTKISKHYTLKKKVRLNLSGLKDVIEETPLALPEGIPFEIYNKKFISTTDVSAKISDLQSIREGYLQKRRWRMPSNTKSEGIKVAFNELPVWWQDWLRQGKELPLWWFSLIYSAYHILIVARTRGGKSQITYSLIQDIIASKGEPNKIVILDPHGSSWGEILPIGRQVNFPAIKMAMREILSEMYKRLSDYSNGKTEFEGLYIVMDESPAIKDELEDAFINFIKTIAQNAAKVNIHLIILTQSKLVKDMGLEGRSDMRKAFTMLLLSNEALKELPEEYLDDNDPYPVVLSYDDFNKKVSREFVPFLNQYKAIKKENEYVIEGLPEPPSIEELVNSKIPAEDTPVLPTTKTKRIYNRKEKKDVKPSSPNN